MTEILERKDQDPKYLWNINSMYESADEWQKSYENIVEKMPEIEALKGNLLNSANALLNALNVIESISREVENLAVYAHMNLDQDTRVAESQAIQDKAMSLFVQFNSTLSFFKPELMELDEKTWAKFKEDEPKLALYDQFMDDILRRKEHILPGDQERIIASFGEVLNTPSKTYSMLTNADFEFPDVEDQDGESHKLTSGTYIPLLESKDRVLRKNAFDALYKQYEHYENAITSMLYGELKGNQVIADLRNFETSRQAALFENNIPVEVYDALIKAVHDNMDTMYDYMKLRKEALDLDELHMYDIYTPIVESDDEKIDFDESLKMIEKALQPLGEEYVSTAMKGFESGWVDVYENKGKRSGAYSSGSYDSDPFILLNYQGTLDNVFTTIHEMGHSMHSYLTKNNQPYAYGNYSIFLAEIASTCNELLLLHSLMEEHKDDEKVQKQLINHYLESFRMTVYRQTMFAEFEYLINEQMQKGGEFTAEWLNKTYHDLNKLYYGEHVEVDELIGHEWKRIPHFYYNYYVFQYATGFSAAVTFSERILKEGQPAVDQYLKFLKSGSSDYPIEVLKEAGVDMTSKDVVDYALKKFKSLVEEMKNLI